MKGILRRPLAVVLAAGLAALVIGTSVVIGATVVATNGGPVTAVRTKTATDTLYSTNTSPTDLAGMTLSVDVPANQQAIFVVTFSSETTCTGSVSYTQCAIRVLLDGSTARPGEVVLDATDNTPSIAPWKTKSMQFVVGPAGPGTHYVKVQKWSGSSTTFGVRMRTLTVLRSQV